MAEIEGVKENRIAEVAAESAVDRWLEYFAGFL